jgi:hypothetical protein
MMQKEVVEKKMSLFKTPAALTTALIDQFRESRLWLNALVSAIASVVSALTALLVVFRK